MYSIPFRKQPLLLWATGKIFATYLGPDKMVSILDGSQEFMFPASLHLAEQERIVAKLDELMANCDQLEMKAEEMKNYTSKLFEASLKEAFAPE